MKAPPTFRLTLTGRTIAVINQQNADAGNHLAYILRRLVTGSEVADDALESYGIKVEISEAPGTPTR